MKPLIFLAVLAPLCFLLAACGGGDSGDDTTDEGSPDSAEDGGSGGDEDALREKAQECAQDYLDGDTVDAYKCYHNSFKEKCSLGEFGALRALAAGLYESFYGVNIEDVEVQVTGARIEEDKGYPVTELFVEGERFGDEGDAEDEGEYWILEDGDWLATDSDSKPCEADFDSTDDEADSAGDEAPAPTGELRDISDIQREELESKVANAVAVGEAQDLGTVSVTVTRFVVGTPPKCGPDASFLSVCDGSVTPIWVEAKVDNPSGTDSSIPEVKVLDNNLQEVQIYFCPGEEYSAGTGLPPLSTATTTFCFGNDAPVSSLAGWYVHVDGTGEAFWRGG